MPERTLHIANCKHKPTHLKLDTREAEIRSYLAKGISKRSIAKLVDCSPSTLYEGAMRFCGMTRPEERSLN